MQEQYRTSALFLRKWINAVFAILTLLAAVSILTRMHAIALLSMIMLSAFLATYSYISIQGSRKDELTKLTLLPQNNPVFFTFVVVSATEVAVARDYFMQFSSKSASWGFWILMFTILVAVKHTFAYALPLTMRKRGK